MWKDELKELRIEASYWTGKEKDIMNFIKSLLKKQRDICADRTEAFMNPHDETTYRFDKALKGYIKDSPEPRGKK